MMATVLSNATLVQLDPPTVQAGGLRIEGERIAQVGRDVTASAGDEVLDCGGAVVMPGLVNGHTHLYSALAPGMPPPQPPPANFHEILRFIWWRLDRALDLPVVRTSAAVGALAALRCGVTTLIDHHASPGCIAGSLDEVAAGLTTVGLRGVLCYEVTERNGREDAGAGLAENERFANAVAGRRDGRFAAMVGAHAAFTLADDDLAACVALASRLGTAVHVHVAEDGCDDALCRGRYGRGLFDRLSACGLLDTEALLAHAIHLTVADLARLNESRCMIAHNPRSNMNNGVGRCALERLRRPLLLGTDGIGSDLFAEVQVAGWLARHGGAPLAGPELMRMLGENARFAARRLEVRLGLLEPGAAADVLVTDYIPPTPLTPQNLAGHVLFAMGSHHVRTVFVAGRARLLDRQIVGMDEAMLRREAADAAARLWDRMARLRPDR